MSALYGRLESESGKQSTRCGHHSLRTTAETWQGIVAVELTKDGGFSVSASGKHGEDRIELARGNVNTRELEILPGAQYSDAWKMLATEKEGAENA